MIEVAEDPWARWLLERRYGGDADQRQVVREALLRVRERVLQQAQVAEGATVLDVGSSGWVVSAGPEGYFADEAYFLHFIIHTVHTALAAHPHLDAARFAAWIEQRHAQVEQGALVYMTHQLDFLGRTPTES